MYKKILIIGQGSAGQNHFGALKSINKKAQIILTSSRNFMKTFKNKNYEKLRKLNPDLFVVCSPATTHFKFIKLIESHFTKKNILIEKPLFSKREKTLKNLKNNYFVGYNLRFHPILQFLKDYIKGKKFFFIRVICSSFLPKWRNKKKYSNTVSANKRFGGGVKLELSHEMDYLRWIFGKIKIINSFNKKISNLKINVDDVLCLHGIIKNKIFLNLDLNFFSRIDIRKIFIDGNDFSLQADLLSNKIKIIEKNKRKIIIKRFNLKQTFINEHLDILKKRKFICTFKEALENQKILEAIKS